MTLFAFFTRFESIVSKLILRIRLNISVSFELRAFFRRWL